MGVSRYILDVRKEPPSTTEPGTPDHFGLPADPAAAGWRLVHTKTFSVRGTLGGRLRELPHERREALRALIGDGAYEAMAATATDYARSVNDPDDAEALYDALVAAGFDAGVFVGESWDIEPPPDWTAPLVFEGPEERDAFIRMLAKYGVPVIRR